MPENLFEMGIDQVGKLPKYIQISDSNRVPLLFLSNFDYSNNGDDCDKERHYAIPSS